MLEFEDLGQQMCATCSVLDTKQQLSVLFPFRLAGWHGLLVLAATLTLSSWHSLAPFRTHTRACRLPPTAPPLTLGLSTAICRCKLPLQLNAKWISISSLAAMFYFIYLFLNDTQKDPVVLKLEVCCNSNGLTRKQINHFGYSFNNCSTGNAVLDHFVCINKQ